MKRILIFLAVCCCSAQQFNKVTIVPSTNAGGTPVASGQICFEDLGVGPNRHTVCIDGPGSGLTNLPSNIQITIANGISAPLFSATNAGAATAFQTGNGTSVGLGNGNWAMQGLTALGIVAAQGLSTPSGGYVLLHPVTYNQAPTPCYDVFHNEVNQPVPAPGQPPFGTNDIVMWAGTSSGPGVGCQTAWPLQEDVGLNVAGYGEFMGGVASINNTYAAHAVYTADGKIAGGVQGNTFYAGWLVPRLTNLTAVTDQPWGSHWNNNQAAAGNTYAVGDRVSVTCATTNAVIQITAISGGGGTGPVSGYEVIAPGDGCSVPASNVATTAITGSGTGFKLNLTGTTAVLNLGGSVYIGHSCGPPKPNYPTYSYNITNSTNPLPVGLGLQQGASYFDDCLHTARYLMDDLVTWVNYPGSGGSGSPGGPQYAVQINNPPGTFAGYATLTYPGSGILTASGAGGGFIAGDATANHGVFNAGIGYTGTCTPGTHTFQNSDSSWSADSCGNILTGASVAIGAGISGAPSSPTILELNGYITAPVFASLSPVSYISASQNTIAGIEMANASSGTSADFRFVVSDTTGTGGNYLAFFMPGTGNTGTLFGYARNQITGVFGNTSAGGNGRVLVLGTANNNDLVLGSDNVARVDIGASGTITFESGTGLVGHGSNYNQWQCTDAGCGENFDTFTANTAFLLNKVGSNPGTAASNTATVYLNTSNQLVATISGAAAAQICTVGTCPGGTGSANTIAYWTSSTGLTYDSALAWNPGTLGLSVTGTGATISAPQIVGTISGTGYAFQTPTANAYINGNGVGGFQAVWIYTAGHVVYVCTTTGELTTNSGTCVGGFSTSHLTID